MSGSAGSTLRTGAVVDLAPTLLALKGHEAPGRPASL
jgi:hypothetical protein